MDSFDLIIIGGGSAGLTAAETAVMFRKNIALVAERLGGDCLWNGCVPSKAMIAAAQEAKLKGLSPKEGWKLVRSRVEHATTTIQTEHDNATYYRDLGIIVYETKATFLDPHRVRVGDHILTARRFLICTGSRPRIPAIPGLEDVAYLTNEDVFTLEQLPESVVIVGGGPIGCELGQALQMLGCQTTILQNGPQLIPKDEPEASTAVLESLLNSGVDVRLESTILDVRKSDDIIQVTIEQGGQRAAVTSSAILIATGRRPNIEALGLQKAGITVTDKGITHDQFLRTSRKNIFVAGDVAGDFQFTHYASAQAGVAVQNAFIPLLKTVVSQTVPWCTFTTPEVAHTGITTAMARTAGIQYTTTTFPFNRVDRAIAEKKTTGFIHLVFDRRQTVIGATIVGEHAGEIIQTLTLAIQKQCSVRELLNSIHVYPTYSSGIAQALFYHFKSSDTLLLKFARFISRLL